MLSALVSVLLLLPPGGPSTAQTAWEPSPTPVSWELTFKFLDPQRIEVTLPGSSQPETYWYVVYTVVNTNRRGQRFFPIFQIVTDDLKVYDTDVGINPLVFDAIRQRHAVTHKYLEPPTKVIGVLLSGEDNARESVAVWRQIDLTVNSFGVYVAGLSGETRFIANPAFDPERPETGAVAGSDGRTREIQVNPRNFTLRKTLEIRYNLPGSPQARPGVMPERGQVRWIMR